MPSFMSKNRKNKRNKGGASSATAPAPIPAPTPASPVLATSHTSPSLSIPPRESPLKRLLRRSTSSINSSWKDLTRRRTSDASTRGDSPARVDAVSPSTSRLSDSFAGLRQTSGEQQGYAAAERSGSIRGLVTPLRPRRSREEHGRVEPMTPTSVQHNSSATHHRQSSELSSLVSSPSPTARPRHAGPATAEVRPSQVAKVEMIATSREVPPATRSGSFGTGDALGLAMGTGIVGGNERVSTGFADKDVERRDDGEERVGLGTHVRGPATTQASPQHFHSPSPQQDAVPTLAPPLTFDRSLAHAEPSRSYITRSPAQRDISSSDATQGIGSVPSVGDAKSGAARERRVSLGEEVREVIEDPRTHDETVPDPHITPGPDPTSTTRQSISATPVQDVPPPKPFHDDDVFSGAKGQSGIPSPSASVDELKETVQGDQAYSLAAPEPVVKERTMTTPRLESGLQVKDVPPSAVDVAEPGKETDVQRGSVIEESGALANAEKHVTPTLDENSELTHVGMRAEAFDAEPPGVRSGTRAETTVATSVPAALEMLESETTGQDATESRHAIHESGERSPAMTLDKHHPPAPESAVQETTTPVPAVEAEPRQSVQTLSSAGVALEEASVQDPASSMSTSLQEGNRSLQAMEDDRYSAPAMRLESQSGGQPDRGGVATRAETMGAVVGAGDGVEVPNVEKQGGVYDLVGGSSGISGGMQARGTGGSTGMGDAQRSASANQEPIARDALEPPRSQEDDMAAFGPVTHKTTVPFTEVATASHEPGPQDAPADIGSEIVSGEDPSASISADIHADVLFYQQSPSAVSETEDGVLDSVDASPDDSPDVTGSGMRGDATKDASVTSPASKPSEIQRRASVPPAEPRQLAAETQSVNRAPDPVTPTLSQKKRYSSPRTSSHSSYNASADPDEANLHEARTSASTAFMNRGGMWIGTPPVPLDSVAIKTLEMAQREPRSPSAVVFPTDNLGEVSTSESSLVAHTPPASRPPMLPFVPRLFAPKLTLEFKWADRLLPSDVTLDTTDAAESSGTPQRGRRISLYETAMALSGYGANFVPRNRVTSRAHVEHGKR